MGNRISELAAIAALDDDDLLVVVEDGTTKKVTVSQLRSALAMSNGWFEDTRTWTYASATTFTVAGVDVREQFPKGTRIRLKQGGSYKYFVVVGNSFSTDTTVTITGGTTHTLANAAITDNAYSYVPLPGGYPATFAYTPTWTGDGSNPSLGNGTLTGTFQVFGSRCLCTVSLALGSTTTTGSGGWRFSTPVTPASSSQIGKGAAQGIDSGSTQYTAFAWTDGANLRISASGDWNGWWKNTYPISWGNGDLLNAEWDYAI